MIKIIIEGPQGAGKTALAGVIAACLEDTYKLDPSTSEDFPDFEQAVRIVRDVVSKHDIEIETRQENAPVTHQIKIDCGEVDPAKLADLFIESLKVTMHPVRKPTLWEKVKSWVL